MVLSFFIPFTIALIAVYLGYQSREEIVATFSFVVAFLSLVLSFVLAPWMIQMLILIVGLMGMRYFCHRHSCQHSKPESGG